ncbi:MAG: hypothetical protein ACK46X_21755 [Candidatus Sericytochromatia bacterium]
MIRLAATLMLVAVLTPGAALAAAPQPDRASAAHGPVDWTVGRWMIPAVANTRDWDASFARATWTGEAIAWSGDWGLGAGGTLFGATTLPGAARDLPANTLMGDLTARYRLLDGSIQLLAGFRPFSHRHLSYGTVGFTLDRALPLAGLAVEAKGLAGANLGRGYVLDGTVGLAYQLGPARLSLGFRQLDMVCGADSAEPLVTLGGPIVGLSARL